MIVRICRCLVSACDSRCEAGGKTHGGRQHQVVQGRTALADLAGTGAEVVNNRVVDAGDLITTGGVTAGIDLALWTVERFASREVADWLAQRIEYPRSRPVEGS